MEDSELHSDRTLDDDDDDDDADDQDWSVAVTSQRRPSTDHAHGRRQSPPPVVELERRQSAPADHSHSPDSDLKDDDWTYPDDNSPSNGSPQQRERRDSGVGSSLTRTNRSVCLSLPTLDSSFFNG